MMWTRPQRRAKVFSVMSGKKNISEARAPYPVEVDHHCDYLHCLQAWWSTELAAIVLVNTTPKSLTFNSCRLNRRIHVTSFLPHYWQSLLSLEGIFLVVKFIWIFSFNSMSPSICAVSLAGSIFPDLMIEVNTWWWRNVIVHTFDVRESLLMIPPGTLTGSGCLLPTCHFSLTCCR